MSKQKDLSPAMGPAAPGGFSYNPAAVVYASIPGGHNASKPKLNYGPSQMKSHKLPSTRHS